MTIKKTPEQKMIDKALELVEQFRSGDITQNDIQAKIGKVFGGYSSIENRMVTPADEAKFTKVRIRGEHGSKVNSLRGELYTNAIGRMKTAIEGGYYFECISLCDTVIVDRLDAWTQALLHTSERQFPASTVGTATVFLGKTMTRLEITKSKEDTSLFSRIDAWGLRRNEVLHNFVIINEANAHRDVGVREQYALETSVKGYALVREVLVHTDNAIKKIKDAG